MTTPADPTASVPDPGQADPISPPPEIAPDDHNVNRAARGNAVWTMGGFIAMQVLRLGSTLLLTRLLMPDAFGTMALVNTVLQGLQMFTDIGIGPSLVQNKRGEDADFLNTAWTLMVGRGFLLWGLAIVASFPLHLIYPHYDPPFYFVLPAVAATAAIRGFESTSIYTLQRRLMRARRVLLEVGTYALTMALTILGCWYLRRSYSDNLADPGFLRGAVWIMVASNLFSTVMEVAVSHFLIRGYRNRFSFDRTAFHDLFHFGKWVFISTLFTFLAMQMDRLIIGADQATLGIYAVAINLAMIPGQLLNTVGWYLVFPLYTRLHQAGQEIRSTFQRLHPLASGFAAFLIAGLIGAGPSLICLMYDIRYHEAGWMLQIMALGVWFQALEVLEASVLWTQGDTKSPMLSNIIKVVALILFVPLGQMIDGFRGMLFGFVAADFVRYAYTMLAARKRGLSIIRYDVAMTVLLLISAGLALWLGQTVWPEPPFDVSQLSVLLVVPDGGLPGALPLGPMVVSTKKPWLYYLERSLTEGGFIVLFWTIPAFYCWKKGLFRVALKREI